MPKSGLYRGYSSFEFQSKKSFKINDIDLVKLDLLNHIFTLRGERLMMPTFGTTIPTLVFEPLDAEMLEQLEDELLTAFNFDPRVEILNLELFPSPDDNLVSVVAKLLYIELNVVEGMEFNIIFEAG